MKGIYTSPVASSIPFDPGSSFAPTVTDVQTAIEAALHPDPQFQADSLFDDFDNRMTWSPSTSGTGSSASVSGGNSTYASGKHLGVAQLSYGSVGPPSHASLVHSGNLSISTVFGSGMAQYKTLIRIPTLATAAEDYIFRCGYGTSTNQDHADGIYFEYNRATSANWILKTASNSSRTSSTSSIAVTAGAWISLSWEVNEAGTSVEYFVDGVSAGTITTNIPTTTGRGCGPNYQLVAAAIVTGGRSVAIDYFFFNKHFTARD